ncbi:hypothetical protein F8568_024495 [Actinomadura sp. LD22]|uniref:Uncharacterized protein n=1 Tax=Actinomadura physcomitrii TaxID=2650748 RepID=A0A6I4MCN3_9ACTN|nr:hypothetical protein [Actinomadura physcomitrii]MWA03482.1 hypothetical protein [Actinomadura physcomitrii]
MSVLLAAAGASAGAGRGRPGSRTVPAGSSATAPWQALVPLVAGAVLIAGYAVRALRARRTPPIIDVRMFRSTPSPPASPSCC